MTLTDAGAFVALVDKNQPEFLQLWLRVAPPGCRNGSAGRIPTLATPSSSLATRGGTPQISTAYRANIVRPVDCEAVPQALTDLPP